MMSKFLVLILIFPVFASATVPESFTQKNISYRTYFGECPSKSSGVFALMVMKEFEKNRSLKDVKEKILLEKLDEKYFLSDYRISYNPFLKKIKIDLDCPEPLAKVQIYKSNGEEHFSAILGNNGKIYEPGFENLLRLEKKLTGNIPLIALSLEQLNGDAPTSLTSFLKLVDRDLRSRISEVLINKNNELTIVFALGNRATSVFMGADFWDEKVVKLKKIISYVSKNKRFPTSINLLNTKKVVVKFSDKI